MAKIFPIHPARPELICWGCDRYCAVGSMACGNGSDRTQHPVELFGEDWNSFGLNQKDALPDAPRDLASPAPIAPLNDDETAPGSLPGAVSPE